MPTEDEDFRFLIDEIDDEQVEEPPPPEDEWLNINNLATRGTTSTERALNIAQQAMEDTIREDRIRALQREQEGRTAIRPGGQQPTPDGEQTALFSTATNRLWDSNLISNRPRARAFTLSDAVPARPDEARTVTPSKRGKDSGPQYNRIRFTSSLEGDK